MYVRGDSLIPRIEPEEYIKEEPFDFVQFDGYIFNKAQFELFDQDGVTQVSVSINGGTLDIHLEGIKKRVGFQINLLNGMPKILNIQVDGQELKEFEVPPSAER